MVTIADHTIEESLLSKDSKVLDLGCRGFEFAEGILKYVDKVYCVDADDQVRPPEDERIKYLNVAVGSFRGIGNLVKHGNGSGNFLYDHVQPLPTEYEMQGVSIWPLKKVSEHFYTETWDVIKMDIEGSEISVLMDMISPLSKQLSIEFHMHTGSSEAQVKLVLQHLKQWYDIVFVDYSDKHGCGLNWWDVLAVQK